MSKELWKRGSLKSRPEPGPLRQVFKIRHLVSKVELCSYCCWILMSKSPKGRQEPGPLFLPPRPPWRGANSCLRGHIWPMVIRAFDASKAISHLRPFCGSNHQIRPTNHIRIWLKWATFKPKFWLKCDPSNYWDLNQINYIYALLSRIQLCRDYALFEGHFWPKFGDGGTKT